MARYAISGVTDSIGVPKARWRQDCDGKPFTGVGMAWLRNPHPLAAGCETAEPADILLQVSNLLKFLRESDLPAEIAVAHIPYVMGRVHPFADGNGHAGRFFMCHFLAQAGVSVHTLVAYPKLHRIHEEELYELFRASALGDAGPADHVAFQLNLLIDARRVAMKASTP